MPWNDQSNGAGSGGGDKGGEKGGPWGGGPRRPWGAPTPPPQNQGPDLEDMLRGFRERMRFGGGGGGARLGKGPGGLGWPLILLLVLVVWVLSGVYIVDEGERGVVMRFGQYSRTVEPGLHVHMPPPIETRNVVNVAGLRPIEIGCATQGGECVDNPDESLMITGDRNIVEIHFKVSYVVSSAYDFVFNVEQPEEAVRAVAESAMREVIGKRQLGAIMTQNRTEVTTATGQLMQQILNNYHTGVRVVQVQLLTAAAPPTVVEAFNDVVKARQDQESKRNVATRYANEVVPRARGEAAQIVRDAEAYRDRVVHEANGEAARFDAIAAEYRRAPRVTRDRIYLETMEQIYRDANTVILERGSGAVPYLSLDNLRSQNTAPTPRVTPAPGAR